MILLIKALMERLMLLIESARKALLTTVAPPLPPRLDKIVPLVSKRKKKKRKR